MADMDEYCRFKLEFRNRMREMNVPDGTDLEMLVEFCRRHQYVMSSHGKCEWTTVGNKFMAQCGATITIESTKNNRFCPCCGKTIKEI